MKSAGFRMFVYRLRTAHPWRALCYQRATCGQHYGLWAFCVVVAGLFVGTIIAHYLGHHGQPGSLWHTVQHVHTLAWWNPWSWEATFWHWYFGLVWGWWGFA